MTLKAKSKKRSSQTKSKLKLENSDISFVYMAANAASEKKGEDILVLDVRKLTVIADYFIIITAQSTPQVDAIAKYIEEILNKCNCKLISKEGFVQSSWVVLDYGNIIIHIMNEKERNYYKLEKFWSNATFVESKVWKKAS